MSDENSKAASELAKLKSDKLNPKQEAFVKEVVVNQTSPTQAAINAGYNVSTRASATAIGSRLMGQPKIQNALAEALDKKYPDLTDKAVAVLWDSLNDPAVKPETKLKMLEFLAKVKGWLAPTKHASVNVSVQDKFKLPEE